MKDVFIPRKLLGAVVRIKPTTKGPDGFVVTTASTFFIRVHLWFNNQNMPTGECLGYGEDFVRKRTSAREIEACTS